MDSAQTRKVAVFFGRLAKELARLTPLGAMLTMQPRRGPVGILPLGAGVAAAALLMLKSLPAPALLCLALGFAGAALLASLNRRDENRRAQRRERYRRHFTERSALVQDATESQQADRLLP